VGLFDRSATAKVAVAPAMARPRQPVTATVTTHRPVDKVRSARLEWGYDNFYRYHWAGRADSAAAAGNDTLWTAGQVGTSYGGERDTDDWVCVTQVEIPVATGELSETTATFQVPSWAPGSSPEVARWACRLVVDREGRDVDARGEFQVVIGVADVDAVEAPMERYMGNAETLLDIMMPSPVWRAGEPVTGHLVVRPQQDLPDADIAVYWQRHREHHPLERYPALGGALDGPPLHLGKKIPMQGGAEFGLPFALPLPADAAPSATAVHSSVSWCVGARIFYAGFNSHMVERVRRPIVVINAA
jgi:hypothetical protein